MKSTLLSIVGLMAAGLLVASGVPVAYAQQSAPPAAQQKAPAGSQTGAPTQPDTATKNQQKSLSSADKEFADSASRDGMLQIAVAKEAEKKSSNPDVKNLARSIIEDRTKADLQLKRIAQKEAFELPDTLDSSGQNELQKLSGLTGIKFDHAFLKFAVSDYRKAVIAFDNQAQQGTEPSLKTFASNTALTLKKNLSMAESVNRELTKSGSKPWWEFWKK